MAQGWKDIIEFYQEVNASGDRYANQAHHMLLLIKRVIEHENMCSLHPVSSLMALVFHLSKHRNEIHIVNYNYEEYLLYHYVQGEMLNKEKLNLEETIERILYYLTLP